MTGRDMALPNAKPRGYLTELFQLAVAEADPMKVVPRQLPERPKGRVIVIGAGKASARMAEAVESVWGPCEGLVITRYGYARPCKGIEIVEAAHPVPDAAGEAATCRLMKMVNSLGPDDLVVALISGGGSSLLCAPAEGLSLADKMSINSALLASGAPIGDMNVVRKHLSSVKGGRLAAACHPARLVSLMISDVPGDDPAMIASGPTVGEASTPSDAIAILDNWNIPMSPSVASALKRPSSVVVPNDPRLSNAHTHIVAAPSASLAAAAAKAESDGCDVRQLGDDLEGEARDLGATHAALALEIKMAMKPNDAPVLLLSGGECTVTRRGNGTGGPNAEYALSALSTLRGAPGIHVLACDTDGVDGVAEIAGAYAGPVTWNDATKAGLDPTCALADNDAHSFFGRLQSQIVTGPTLTNVNDFRAFLIVPEC